MACGIISDVVFVSDYAELLLVQHALCLHPSFGNVLACHRPLDRAFALLSHRFFGPFAFDATDRQLVA